MQEENREKDLKKELYVKVLVLIILIFLLIITSFNTGRKFYLLKNTYFDSTNGEVNSGIARWNFKAKVIIGEVNTYEE